MYDIERILQLLEEKHACFDGFYKASKEMLSCEIELLELLMEKRQAFIDEIERIEGLLQQAAPDDAAQSAAHAQGRRGELPEALQPVYDRAMRIRALLCALPDLNKQVEIRMEVEQERVLARIKSANKGQSAQAAKFYGSMGASPYTSPSRLGNA